MATSVENPAEHDTASLADNSHPQQKRGSDDDLGVGAGEKRWPGWPGESVFRILVPAPKVGGIIGRKGEFIKKICEESRARIKILDGPPAIKERAVIISAKEEPDVATPPAVDGLLRIHRRIIDGLNSESAPPAGGTVSTRLLVAAAQAGSLIGRQGATVKSIQEASGVIVRVLGPEELPPFALQDDRIVEVQGDPAGVLKAVELIASHLRKFLVDRSVIPLFEKHMSPSGSQVDQHMPHHPWGHPQGPQNSSGPVYGGNSQFMPSRQHDGYYPPPDLPPLDRHHPSGPLYGQIHSSMNAQPPPPIIKQMTQQMQIPLSYADAVIGSSGANISYIRRASGATVTIQESRGVLGEMTVEINGTATQVQTAQQLIQNAMAEAAGRPQNPPGPVDPAYNSYPPRGPTYASPPPSAGHAGHHASGGYGTTYGANYGY